MGSDTWIPQRTIDVLKEGDEAKKQRKEGRKHTELGNR
jgi:hypothetical protein